jgi:hypothetical protein
MGVNEGGAVVMAGEWLYGFQSRGKKHNRWFFVPSTSEARSADWVCPPVPHHRNDEYQHNVRTNRFANRDHERRIAEAFHKVYEHLAPLYGWTTQERSAVPWGDLPENQQQLMKAVVSELLRTGVICPLGKSA